MSRKPLNSRKISELADLEDGTQARTMIGKLNKRYDQQQRSFQVKKVAGGYQLRTRPQFADWIRRQEHVPKPSNNRLSAPALETLTVVAYRQPIIKADIEAIRGVNCGEMLRQLLEKGLVKITGRSEHLGRPFLYATSKDFLVEFGFNSLATLPRSKQLSGPGLPDWLDSEKDEPQPNPTSLDDSNQEAISPNSLAQPETRADPSTNGSAQEKEE
ncbi:SMC-Scp complex subunit ScpB [Mariniblastus sp.]|nr:SMC-Scp complex subunit ScpB [Mariniblastus sp.]